MNRKEAYILIQEKGLKGEVASRFGKNYTNVPTEDLIKVIWDYDCTLVEPELKESKKALEEEMDRLAANMNGEVGNPYEAACIAFLGILNDCGLLDELLAKL